jgi:UDP-N-acetylmuramate dehydrogenase
MTDPNLTENVSLAEHTTLGIGGSARWFTTVSSVEELSRAVSWAQRRHLPHLFLGEGSNILFSDRGYPGLIIKNRIVGCDREGDEVVIGGGANLGDSIRTLNRMQLAGMERMYGIPGSVAGAVVGNAGAYGQEIKDVLVEVTAWSAAGARTLSSAEAGFDYRHSIFKNRRDYFVVSCCFRLRPAPENLEQISEEILARRLVKYPAGLRCPGSFFKNIVAGTLPPKVLAGIPQEFIQYGKIPAGRLLEEVGAKGAVCGDAMIADYHANLLLNRQRAASRDLLHLASEYAQRVWNRFHVRLEPEILIVGNEIPANLTPRRGQE